MARKTTVADAVLQVARHMSMVEGPDVQPYSDTLLISYLEGAHQFIVDEQEWPDLYISYIRTLDGTTGKITEKIAEVTDWKRVTRVYHESSNRPLPYLSTYNNPLVWNSQYAYSGLQVLLDPGATKYLLQFSPVTLSGQVFIEAKLDYDLSDPETVIPIDWWLHVYHASWQYALDDGTNASQAEKYKNLFNVRLAQVKSMVAARPLSLNPMETIPNTWLEFDAQ